MHRAAILAEIAQGHVRFWPKADARVVSASDPKGTLNVCVEACHEALGAASRRSRTQS